MTNDELLSALKENLRVAVDLNGDYEGNYLEVKIYWNREEITSDSINIDHLK